MTLQRYMLDWTKSFHSQLEPLLTSHSKPKYKNPTIIPITKDTKMYTVFLFELDVALSIKNL